MSPWCRQRSLPRRGAEPSPICRRRHGSVDAFPYRGGRDHPAVCQLAPRQDQTRPDRRAGSTLPADPWDDRGLLPADFRHGQRQNRRRAQRTRCQDFWPRIRRDAAPPMRPRRRRRRSQKRLRSGSRSRFGRRWTSTTRQPNVSGSTRKAFSSTHARSGVTRHTPHASHDGARFASKQGSALRFGPSFD